MLLFFLIDDDEDDREFFQLAVKAIDLAIVCETASGGNEALAILKEKKTLPDIIFLDLNMPQMDGRECLQALKSDSKAKHVPVVIFSTSSEPYDVEHVKKMGAADFVTKPSRLSELSECINSMVRLHLNIKN